MLFFKEIHPQRGLGISIVGLRQLSAIPIISFFCLLGGLALRPSTLPTEPPRTRLEESNLDPYPEPQLTNSFSPRHHPLTHKVMTRDDPMDTRYHVVYTSALARTASPTDSLAD